MVAPEEERSRGFITNGRKESEIFKPGPEKIRGKGKAGIEGTKTPRKGQTLRKTRKGKADGLSEYLGRFPKNSRSSGLAVGLWEVGGHRMLGGTWPWRRTLSDSRWEVWNSLGLGSVHGRLGQLPEHQEGQP